MTIRTLLTNVHSDEAPATTGPAREVKRKRQPDNRTQSEIEVDFGLGPPISSDNTYVQRRHLRRAIRTDTHHRTLVKEGCELTYAAVEQSLRTAITKAMRRDKRVATKVFGDITGEELNKSVMKRLE